MDGWELMLGGNLNNCQGFSSRHAFQTREHMTELSDTSNNSIGKTNIELSIYRSIDTRFKAHQFPGQFS